MDLTGARVLAIGGAGLIGSHLIDQLLGERVEKITIYDNFARGRQENIAAALADDRVEVFADGGDINQVDTLNAAVGQADCVFHLAALWLLQCYQYPRSAFQVNVEGTFNVLEACVANDIAKLVFSSSASVYGDALHTPMGEDHPFNNRTFYGASKIAGEQMCRAYNERYGLDYVGLRYMNVYGPRQDYKGAYIAVIMKILDRIDQGLPPIVYGDGSQAYDFVYVEDIARANICALKSDATDQFYNVGSGIKTTVAQLCQLLLELTGSPLKIEYQPEGQTFVSHRVGTTQRAAADLGFKAQVELRHGLEQLIAWRARHKARWAA